MKKKKIVIALNPGSGPVSDATEQHAQKNIQTFVNDLACRGVDTLAVKRTPKQDYGEGRYAFSLRVTQGEMKRTREIQMPGLPLSRVRYIDREKQDIWEFPRLYVDGSSWVWFFALDATVPAPEEDVE